MQQKAHHVTQVYKNSLLVVPYTLHQHNSDFCQNTLNRRLIRSVTDLIWPTNHNSSLSALCTEAKRW